MSHEDQSVLLVGSSQSSGDARTEPHRAGDGRHTKSDCEVTNLLQDLQLQILSFSGRVWSSFQISVNFVWRSSEKVKRRKKNSIRLSLKLYIRKNNSDIYLIVQLLCGTDPFPTDFRAKKYKLHRHFLSKTDFQHMMRSLPVPVSETDIEEMFTFADKGRVHLILICYLMSLGWGVVHRVH